MARFPATLQLMLDTAALKLVPFVPRTEARRTLCVVSCESLRLLHRLGLRKLPRAVDDFLSRPAEAHPVVPAPRDRQAVERFPVAAAELDRDRTVLPLLRPDAVERV